MGLPEIKEELLGLNLPVSLQGEMTDTLISSKISKFSYDEEKVKELRRKNREEVIKLQKAMKRVAQRDTAGFRAKTIADIRRYESTLKRQFKDTIQIIRLCSSLIRNEFYEILFDIRNPLLVFEKFFTSLQESLRSSEPGDKVYAEIRTILPNIQKNYLDLINHTISYVHNELRYYNSIGLNFSMFDESKETEIALSTHIRNRAKIKQKINGKAQWILSRIKRLLHEMKSLEQKGQIPKAQGKLIIDALEYFTGQFNGLIRFCEDRIEIADHMIVEAIVLQKDHYKDLEALKAELHEFYQNFLMEQSRLAAESGSRWKTEQINRRINEFRRYQERLTQEMNRFHELFNREVLEVEKEDIKLLSMEKKEEEQAISRLKRFMLRFRKIAAVMVASGMIAGAGIYASPDNVKISLAKGAYSMISRTGGVINSLLSADSEFASRFGQDDIRFRITDNAIRHLHEGGYIGTKALGKIRKVFPKFPMVMKEVKPMDCIRFVNTVMSESVKGHKKRKLMDQVISDYKKKGWDIYFVTKDIKDKSRLLKGQTAEDYIRAAKRGRYPYVGRIRNYVIGPEQVKEFQRYLKGKVAMVSFNSGFHSAFILDGKVVQAHYWAAVMPVIEGIFSLEGQLSKDDGKGWEFAVVAVAPG